MTEVKMSTPRHMNVTMWADKIPIGMFFVGTLYRSAKREVYMKIFHSYKRTCHFVLLRDPACTHITEPHLVIHDYQEIKTISVNIEF